MMTLTTVWNVKEVKLDYNNKMNIDHYFPQKGF